MKCIDIIVELLLACFYRYWDFLSKVIGSYLNIYNGVMGELEIFFFKKIFVLNFLMRKYLE